MTATDILTRWRDASRVMGRHPSAWLTLLRIAECGEDGIHFRELLRTSTFLTNIYTLNKWVDARLITKTPAAPQRGPKRVVYHITPAGLAFLQLDPLATRQPASAGSAQSETPKPRKKS